MDDLNGMGDEGSNVSIGKEWQPFTFTVTMVYKLKEMLVPLLLSMISFAISLLGLILLANEHGLNLSMIAFLSFGFTGLIISIIVWTVRPKLLMTWPKCLKRLFDGNRHFNQCNSTEILDRDKAEMIMRNILGIPYLIQAIQYSMETTYYTSMLAQKNNGSIPPTTSIIHTAPKCTSVIDSDHEDCCCSGYEAMPTEQSTIRAVETIEEWIPTGLSSWNNTQLRLSIKSNPEAGISVRAGSVSSMIFQCLLIDDGVSDQSRCDPVPDKTGQKLGSFY
ncbi:unnamed protein product [Litomosoides sigmodontis]|uniref:Uncharacterized protein n=1 Tax=Litomosoides sigmodontis TaxID=42156 RepID=A0A3P6TH07_LITSI|nr:unnamed protein product [Litomosoides sigmodontis]